MTIYEEINALCLKLLNDLMLVNTYLNFDVNVFSTLEQRKDDYRERFFSHALELKATAQGDKFRCTIENWHSQSMCLTGLILPTHFDAFKPQILNGKVSCRAKLEGGRGARVLCKALDARLVTVVFGVDPNMLDDEYLNTTHIADFDVQFFDESESDLRAIRDELLQQATIIEKQLLVSSLSERYKNFYKLTGLDESDFNKPFVPNSNFDKLFD